MRRVASASVLSLFLWARSGGAQPCAAPALEQTLRFGFSGASLTSPFVADLNGDGAADLVARDFASGGLWVVWGRHDRDFRPAARLEAPLVNELDAVIDFQGHGATDLFVVTAAGVPTLLLGGSAAALRAVPVTGGPSARPSEWRWADLDGDGHLDVVALGGDFLARALETFLGDGNGGFRRVASSPVGDMHYVDSLMDLDGDGIADAIVSNGAGLFAFPGDGHGGFGQGRYLPAAGVPGGLAQIVNRVEARDFDGDGKSDLFLQSFTYAGRGVSLARAAIAWGTGPGAVGPPVAIDSAYNATFAIADMDGDGREDVLTIGVDGVFLRRSLGAREFSPRIPLSKIPVDGVVADLDGDGRPDVVSTALGSSIPAFLNVCDGSPFAKSFVVPVVLSLRGAGGRPFSSEVVLTNRGPTEVSVELTYTAAIGTGSGSARLTLLPGRQRILDDAVAELRALGVPLTEGEPHAGSLRVRFSGAASPNDVSVSARTRSPFLGGEVGVGFAPLPVTAGLLGPSVVSLLREGNGEHTNIAFVSLADAAEGTATLRVTIHSSADDQPASVVLPDVTLAPGEFRQIDHVLAASGLGASRGWASIERVSGPAPYSAYGVLVDDASGDGSVVLARTPAANSFGLTLAVAAETPAYTTELVLTNASSTAQTVSLQMVSAANGTTALAPVKTVVVPGLGQLTLPAFARDLCRPTETLAPPCVGPVSIGIGAGGFAVARTTHVSDTARIGVAIEAAPFPVAQDLLFWLDGLRQDEGHRTNVGLLNFSLDGSLAHYRLDVYDGDTGAHAATIDADAGKGWTQLDGLLGRFAPGVRNAWLRGARTDAGPPFAYAVRNDGARPGVGTGDGTFLPMVHVPVADF